MSFQMLQLLRHESYVFTIVFCSLSLCFDRSDDRGVMFMYFSATYQELPEVYAKFSEITVYFRLPAAILNTSGYTKSHIS